MAALNKENESASSQPAATSTTNGQCQNNPEESLEEEIKKDLNEDIYKAEEGKPSTFADAYSDTDKDSDDSDRYSALLKLCSCSVLYKKQIMLKSLLFRYCI